MGEFKQSHYYEEGSGAGGLSTDDIHEFLASPDSVWLLKLSYLDETGWPMSVPLWYHWDKASFYVVGRKRSKWVQHLRRDSRCAICIEEMTHPRIRKVLAQCRSLRRWPCVTRAPPAQSSWQPRMAGSATW